MSSSNVEALFKRAINELEVSFLLSAKENDLQDPSFVCNQVQLAHYRYIDFWRKNHPDLPEIKKLKDFMEKMFKISKIFCNNDPGQLANYYSQYKSKIPVCGCILLNNDLSKMVLCRNIPDTWMAPAGKMNEGESFPECAVRETYEECGFDAKALINPNQCLSLKVGKKQVHMFVIPNVPENFNFGPTGLAKNEVDQVKFFSLRSYPEKSFRVLEFMPLLEKWIAKYKKERFGNGKGDNDSTNRSTSDSKSAALRPTSNSRHSNNINMDHFFDSRNDSTFDGKVKGWDVQDMFATVESAIGRTIDYNGDPNTFEGHPMYRNYNATSMPTNKTDNKSGGGGSLDFEELSKHSSSFDNFKKDEKTGKIDKNTSTPFSITDSYSNLSVPSESAVVIKTQRKEIDLTSLNVGLTNTHSKSNQSKVADLFSSNPSTSDAENKYISINNDTLSDLLQDLKSCYSGNTVNNPAISFEQLLLSQLRGI